MLRRLPVHATLLLLAAGAAACSDEAGRRRPQRDGAGFDAAAGGRAAGGADSGGTGGPASGGVPSGGTPNGGAAPSDGGTGDGDATPGSTDASADAAPDTSDGSRDPSDAGAPPPLVYDPTTGLTPGEACPAWTVSDSASPEDPVVTNDALVTSTDVPGEGMSFHLTYPQTVSTLPPTVVVEIDARFVSKTAGTRTGSLLGFQLQEGAFSQTFVIDDGEIYLLQDSALGKGPSFAAPTSDTFHTYRIEADATTRAVRVYRDGVLVITHTVISVPALYPVFFGDATSQGGGTTEWRRIAHNLLAPGLCEADASL